MAEIVGPVAKSLPDEPRLTDLASAITNRLYAARSNIRHVLRQPGYSQLLLTAGSLLQRCALLYRATGRRRRAFLATAVCRPPAAQPC